MTIIDYLFWLFVEPLKLLFEVVFYFAFKLTNNAGLSIISMSLVINFLLLPLYFRADKLEKEQNFKKKKISKWTTHIKRHFKGDERIMMTQAYYKISKYKSTDVFKESVSLFLQIPFFLAAYSFLSGLKMLNGISLGPVTNLGAPDQLIHIGAMTINLLPILMTAINIASGFIYSEKGMVKDKIKLVLIALVFLVLLYGSPAGLVFYWTLNNLFSLVKNIVMHYKKPSNAEKAAKSDTAKTKKAKDNKYASALIILSGAVLAVLTGMMIPADVISENPPELVNTFSTDPHSPATYLINSSLTAVGTFLIWIPLFYYLTKEKTEKILMYLAPVFAVNGAINYILFNKNFGLLSQKLMYEYNMNYSFQEVFLNILGNIAVAAGVIFFIIKSRKLLKHALSISLITVTILSGVNIYLTADRINNHNYYNIYDPEDVVAPMTTTGQNVVVIMMDRMIGAYIPYIFNERPDVAAQFDGFTYYPNTISYGAHTNFGVPALYGGYEYTPANINARADELLVDKHNEALRVLPVLFAQNGWNVSVGDPSYANYEWISDPSIYDGYEGINAFLMSGTFNGNSDLLVDAGDNLEIRLTRNMFCFGLMKTLPYFLQPLAYCNGNYNYMDFCYGYNDYSYEGESLHTQIGLRETYVAEYLALEELSNIVDVREDPQNCFFIFANGTTHEVSHLTEPDYLPATNIDTTEYDEAHMDRFTVDGVTMHMDTNYLDYAHYECNMAACISLGQWFDYLRANGLYDNTRIIIVADHGYGLGQFDDLWVDSLDFDAEWVNPVLLVKDFNSTGFTTSYELMTNADTPFLALNGVIDNPVNPFTGNPIEEFDKSGEHLIFYSEVWNVNFNNGTQFVEDPESFWITVRGNIWDDENWEMYSE